MSSSSAIKASLAKRDAGALGVKGLSPEADKLAKGRKLTRRPSHSKKAASRQPAGSLIGYKKGAGIDAYLKQLRDATPLEIVEIERNGIASEFIADLSERMAVPSSRMFAMLRIPKATAARKLAEGAVVEGRAGQAAIGVVKLLAIAQDIVENSAAEGAKGFDVAKWLGQWLERPQPSLGGRKPADLIDTPTGLQIVGRLLGSIQSGAYQ